MTLFLFILIAEAIVLGFFVFYDRIILSLISIAALLISYNLWFHKNAYLDWVNYVVDNPLKIAVFFIVYMAIGVLWSFFQYKRFVRYSFAQRRDKYYVAPGENMDRITNWMLFWHISMLLYALTVPVQDLCKWLYRQFGGVYDRIFSSIYTGEFDNYGRPKENNEVSKVVRSNKR
jgi:hypothetical protein